MPRSSAIGPDSVLPSRSYRHFASFAMLSAALVFAACTPKKDADPSPEPDGDSQKSSAEGVEFTQGQQPVPVTGTNLVTYDNARIRCDYQSGAGASTYQVQCVVVAHQAGGLEYFATGTGPGVSIAWQPPQTVAGSMAYNNCSPGDDQLSYTCNVTSNSNAVPNIVAFAITIQDPTDAPRSEATTLMLPYSVGVAGGFVPSMPFQYVAQPNQTKAAAGSAAQVGFQQFDFAANLTAAPYPTAIAYCGGSIFYSTGLAIFKVTRQQVTYYAGSANVQDTNNLTNAQRLYLQPSALACVPQGGLYVSSWSLGRIYKITDDGGATLIAGNGGSSDGPDGIATQTPIGMPYGVAVDSKGDVIFAEGSMVRMVTPAGNLQTIAGTGEKIGYSGDGGAAKAALLNFPASIAVGSDDSIYIADEDGAVVRKISPAGIITTIAGTGTPRYKDPNNPLALSEPSSIFVDNTGAVFVGEAFRGIKQIGAGGALTQVVSAGADILLSTDNMAQAIDNAMDQKQHSSYAAVINGRPQFYQLAKGSDGTFYVDGHEGVIAFAPGSQTPQIYAGAGDGAPADCASPQPAYLTRLFEASALAIKPDHSLAVLDYLSQATDQLVLRTFTLGSSGKSDTSSATLGCQSNGPLTGFNVGFNQNLFRPAYTIGGMVAASDGSLYIANLGQNLLVKVSPQGVLSTLAGNGQGTYTADGVPAAGASLQSPISLALGADGSVYFIEYGPTANATYDQLGSANVGGQTAGSRLRKITATGILSTVAGTGIQGDSGDNGPAIQAQIQATAVALASDGRIFLADGSNQKIKFIDTQGVIHTIAGGGSQKPSTLGQAMPALEASLSFPSSIAVTNDGTVYVVDVGSDQVLQMKQGADGAWGLVTFFGSARTTDCGTSRISASATAGNLATALQSSLSIMCQGSPRAVTIADTCPAAGGDTRIAISQGSDSFNNIIQVVQPCGT